MRARTPMIVKRSPFRRAFQVSTFLRKEAVDVVRQPRLLLTLVLGPFLLMAAFAVGYRDEAPSMKTVFVVPEGSPFAAQIEQFSDELEDYVDFDGQTSDAVAARERLEDGDVDLVVTFPDQPLETVLAGEQAAITLVHTRLDPIERTAINFSADLAVNQINAQILASVVQAGRARIEPAGSIISAADAAVAGLQVAAQTTGAGTDDAEFDRAVGELEAAVADIEESLRTSGVVSEQLTGAGLGDEGAAAAATLEDMRSTLEEVRREGPEGVSAERLATLDEQLTTVGQQYERFAAVDPSVLVQPFTNEVQIAVPRLGAITDWYAPAAVVLMLQQFGIAFGALTFVRERQLGIVDVFRIAPVNATETLIGKYLAYLLIGSGIGALLMGLVVVALDVPLSSSVLDVALVMVLSLFASIGLGFVISLASANDAQAVQYTMITLLASLFFSGFFLGIGQMEGVAIGIGYLLPVTYGMQLLRDVMLRGSSPDTRLLLGLVAYGIVMFGLALAGTRRRMSLAGAT